MKRSSVLAGIVLLTALLAGCHDPGTTGDGAGGDGMGGGNGNGNTDGNGNGDGGGGNGADPLTVTLTPQNPPSTVTAGTGFDLTVEVESSRAATSTHSGAHWGFNSSANLEPGQYVQALDQVSPHVVTSTSYPGTYTITNWTFSEEDVGRTVYYRAHTILEGEHFWGEELTFTIEAAS